MWLTILNVSVSMVNYFFTASSGTSFTCALSYIKYIYIHEQLYNTISLLVPTVSSAFVKKQSIFYKMILWSLSGTFYVALGCEFH